MVTGCTALVVDDEPQMTAIVEFALQTQGFAVLTAHDGATAMNLLRTHDVDLVVLDVLMPALDGLSLCELIRARSDVPVMLLTALTQQEDVIAGLERGADDYVTKPFHPREVALRAQALVRRRRAPGDGEGAALRVGGLVIDPGRHTVTVGGRRLELPYTEFKLLAHLAARPGRPQSWQDLLRAVWGTADLMGGRDVVRSTVYRLRSRLAALDAARYVQTVRGAGYLMPDAPDQPDQPDQ
ncbi:response regulator transcription factor [Nonomuraea zeae]|uniref:Response regulator transcription factor n=1 Tax=Nonomuraea zeae TaxID=1642303 RepID=A0A5S4FHJ3_9ACTN|nr:response regulator transcription factor [Nonomuraea zeae]TMR19261.1 response regulator transcription factor [Nonomuraea zeae]